MNMITMRFNMEMVYRNTFMIIYVYCGDDNDDANDE